VTANNNMGAAELLRKYLESPAGSDLLGEMVKMAAELLMDCDVDVLCNAGYGERTDPPPLGLADALDEQPASGLEGERGRGRGIGTSPALLRWRRRDLNPRTS